LQALQGLVTILPEPEHLPQVFDTLKNPCWNLT
jgi:hypothetical protein